MSILDPVDLRPSTKLGLAMIGALCVLELLAISLVYQHNFEFICRDVAPDAFCAFASRAVPRSVGVLAALGLFMLARPAALHVLQGHAPAMRAGTLANIAGFGAVLLPWGFIDIQSGGALVLAAAALWSVGGLAMIAGLMLMTAPGAAWAQFFKSHGLTVGALVVVGTFLPELADRVQPLWYSDWVTSVTFDAVGRVLDYLGYAYITDVPDRVIGNSDFAVRVGPSCSGVEGFALISVFLGVYMALFRADLRFPNVILLLPIGLALSWVFNVIRISVLISIGFAGQPDLAVGAFHSHAGWLAFTILSLGLIFVSRSIPFFTIRRNRVRSNMPFFADPVVAQIFPFALFMASGLLVSTFSTTPSLLYPLRAIALALGVALIWPYLRKLRWRLDPVALFSGVAIGMMWVGTAAPSDGTAPFGNLVGAAFMVWIAARLIGTAFLVPIVEELVFRGYVQSRLIPDGAGMLRTIIGVAVVTALFAVLHDRWIVAAIAGLVFSLLALRSRNVTDAIVGHGAANLSIGLWAYFTGAWHIL